MTTTAVAENAATWLDNIKETPQKFSAGKGEKSGSAALISTVKEMVTGSEYDQCIDKKNVAKKVLKRGESFAFKVKKQGISLTEHLDKTLESFQTVLDFASNVNDGCCNLDQKNNKEVIDMSSLQMIMINFLTKAYNPDMYLSSKEILTKFEQYQKLTDSLGTKSSAFETLKEEGFKQTMLDVISTSSPIRVKDKKCDELFHNPFETKRLTTFSFLKTEVYHDINKYLESIKKTISLQVVNQAPIQTKEEKKHKDLKHLRNCYKESVYVKEHYQQCHNVLLVQQQESIEAINNMQRIIARESKIEIGICS